MAVFKPAVAWNNSQLKQRNDFDLMKSIKLDSIAKPVKNYLMIIPTLSGEKQTEDKNVPQ